MYTSAGSRVLISLNPNRPLPSAYDEERMEVHRRGALRGVRPHLFAVAEAAYRAVVRHGTAASVIVSGESGAGKTEASKHLLRYLSWRAAGAGAAARASTVASGAGAPALRAPEAASTLAAKVLHSTPIFEAFGNAVTTRNHNSSRFGKHMSLLLTPNGAVAGARVHTYLLERTRVATPPPPGERNYHIFYYLAAAGRLPGQRHASSFRTLAPSSGGGHGHGSRSSSSSIGGGGGGGLAGSAAPLEAFEGLRRSLSQLFMSEEAQGTMWALLGGLLLLTEIRFEAEDGRGEGRGARVADPEALRHAEEVSGCPERG